ncbi:uncharacterized protein Z520_06344 [Fonsecaea multimorphosa CBS 102226]|uniref:Myb-like DNA-binding domain-containing protein n=1 Tax=Fonsecaea multimorphosa CBS 102226 TaxID=1442371 RepID=A0A0D2K523_9EURO|nr:uncharacterized protein Z520_06344 [Fonsecaea multimorphosa CBS 102226]KIX98264.1 hypothetical protein Z520_06344 [Fonsecaea multimorphosa CBS 102226]OAL22603.1 hypothetical protein AYO22_07161 [Fonsecaea multimorphosa]
MSPTTGNEVFLAACIKYAKEKVVVDFEKLASELKMSKGGAANKYRAIMKQLEEEGAGWNTKDDKAEPKATPAAGVKRKAPSKKTAPPEHSVKAEGGSTSEEAGNEPPKKKARGKATKKNAAKLAEGSDNDKEADVATTTAKKSKGKGKKKVNSATLDDGSLGDDEATPGKDAFRAPQIVVRSDIPTAKMVEAAVSIAKADTVPCQDAN